MTGASIGQGWSGRAKMADDNLAAIVFAPDFDVIVTAAVVEKELI